jgi:hypothetical protein
VIQTEIVLKDWCAFNEMKERRSLDAMAATRIPAGMITVFQKDKDLRSTSSN